MGLAVIGAPLDGITRRGPRAGGWSSGQESVPGSHQVLRQRVRPAARGAEAAMGGVEVDDGLGTRLEVDDMGRRGEVRCPQVRRGHLAGRLELDAQAAAGGVASARTSGRPRGRRSPAVGCTGRTGRRRSTPSDRRAPPRFRSGYVSCGPVPNQSNRSEPGHDLEVGPDPGKVGQLGRDDDASRRPGRRRPRRVVSRCSWSISWPPPVR